jgi:Asp-tRNA(Asn)/Glu-tRNA(Gln) amidotransferase A subunit family amidase
VLEELTGSSATRLAELIRRRAVSAVEVVEAHLRRIERLNPQLNAIVTVAPDVLERARESQERVMRGAGLGALEGVPVTVKDTIETKGLRTTSGSAVRASYVPVEDAPAVARLKAAGAILLGKTNVPEMALTYETDNPVFGRTNNPHDLRRTPGGSSGGEAAAVSAGLSPAGLASDLVGSIRIPAHFCGIVGLKPTTGRVPCAGHFPTATGPYSLAATIGPIARRVEDLSLLLNVIAGYNAPEFVSAPAWGLKDAYTVSTLRGLRVGWYTDDGVSPVTESTRQAVRAAVLALEEAGLTPHEGLPPGAGRGPALWSALFSRAIQGHLRATYAGREASAGEYVRYLLSTLEAGPQPSQDEFVKAWEERDRLRAALVEWMKETPLVVAPVGAVEAFEHGARRVEVCGQSLSVFRAFGYAQTFNVFGLPVCCVPAGRTGEGLPIGVQIIGGPFEEAAVLCAASVIEEALGGWQPPSLAALSPVGHNPL